jgi:pimeloyl-ACP methyl ester carboxylesterase
MAQHNHQTAPTQFVQAKGIRCAYRRFGKTGGVPLVFNLHFTGTMDHWDPAVTDGFAKDREVVLFDNAGISSSSGEVPASIEEMAANAAAFIKALGLTQVDLLGFSLGGLVAQELTLAEPKLVSRLVLAGTGPRSGEGMSTALRRIEPGPRLIVGHKVKQRQHRRQGRLQHAQICMVSCGLVSKRVWRQPVGVAGNAWCLGTRAQ